ncbi:MAG: DUF3078 domain-containing protein [bacterium]
MTILSSGLVAQDIQKVSRAKDEALTGAPADTSKKRWFIQGSTGLTFTQAAFSNWAAGGQNSLGLSAMINLKANYKKGKHAWANTIDLGYGFQIIGKSKEASFNKINDKIELTTAYGFELHQNKKWYLTLLVNFRTQFDKGYNYPNDSVVISKFMAPGYLIAGLGITYTPAKWFYLYLSPASGRFTFVLDTALANQGAFGVEKGKQIRGEFGPYLRADLNKDLAKNINLSTTLELFTNYLKGFGNIDVNWSLLLTMKVNKWLAASIQTQLIYDDDVMIQTDPTEMPGPRTQFKEMIGVGLSYKIN